jgi:hypothetical protein
MFPYNMYSGAPGFVSIFRRAILRAGLGSFRLEACLETLEIHDLSDFKRISIGVMRRRLGTMLGSCREVEEHFPALEQFYRRRRRPLALAALTLTVVRLYTSCHRILNVSPHAEVVSTSSLGFCCRLLRQMLVLVPVRFRILDDALLSMAHKLLDVAEELVLRLDNIGNSVEEKRRVWRRLEVNKQVFGGENLLAFEQARQTVQWSCPTCVSALILFSTLGTTIPVYTGIRLFRGDLHPAS